MVVTNLAETSPNKGDNKPEGDEGEKDEVLPVRGTVASRRRLFQDSVELQDNSPALSTSAARLRKLSRTHSGSPSPSPQGVDATSLEDISSLKKLFENSVSSEGSTVRSPSPIIRAPKPTWSVTPPGYSATILATQLSSPSSAQNSRPGSSILKSVSTSARGSPAQKNFPVYLSSPDVIPKLPLPPPNDRSSLPRPSIPPMTPKGFVPPKTSVVSDHNSAPLAVTIADKSKSSPGLPNSKAQPPKLPPPRRARASLKTPSNGITSDTGGNLDVASINSVTTGYDTTRSSMPLKLSPSKSHLSAPSAPPLPLRRLPIGNISSQSTENKSSATLTTTFLSATSSRTLPTPPIYNNDPQMSPLPPHLTGDSMLAASLASPCATSPAPRKTPALPASRCARRRSLPPPPKTGLRETMREPLKPPPKDLSPQRRPYSVKHNPHEHAGGERRHWRHFVTDKEKERYEVLFDANKGLLLDTPRTNAKTPVSSSIHGLKSHESHNFRRQHHVWSTPNYTEILAERIDSLIVRDIWARSRLPSGHLADVWDLVDRGEKGQLTRDEFIVGTWLIDQSLKGRKLSASVQDEVWQSVSM